MDWPHKRVIDALELREPDRVPAMDIVGEYANVYEILEKKPLSLVGLFSNPVGSSLIDRSARYLNRTGLMDAEMDRFSYDRTAASVKMGYDAAWVAHVPIWKLADSRSAVDIYGRRYDVVFDRMGNLGAPMYREGLIKSPEDWKAWDKRAIFKLPEMANRVFKRIQRDFGDRVFIMAGFLYGLFENTWQPLGFERFAVALRKERDFLRRVIKFYEDHFCMMLEAWADAGVPGAVYADDMTFRSGPMVNPGTLKALYSEALQRITETAHRLGMKIVIHCCGHVYPLLDWFADCGFDGVHPLEPTAGIELARVKEMVGERLCLIGNVDATHILVYAARDEVFEAVRRCIQAAGKNGGYILAPAAAHTGVSVERLRWMLEALEEYGHYPPG